MRFFGTSREAIPTDDVTDHQVEEQAEANCINAQTCHNDIVYYGKSGVDKTAEITYNDDDFEGELIDG